MPRAERIDERVLPRDDVLNSLFYRYFWISSDELSGFSVKSSIDIAACISIRVGVNGPRVKRDGPTARYLASESGSEPSC